MTPCHRDHNDILDFADGGLDPTREKQVSRHVEECCDCARLLHKIRLQRSCLKNLKPLRTGENFNVLLHERIRREMAGKQGLFHPVLDRRWIPASAVAVAVLAVGVWMLTRQAAGPAGLPIPVAVNLTPAAPSAEARRQRVQYVIDDYAPAGAAVSSPDTTVGAVPADSTGRIRNLEALRGRLVPVSF
jgi:anti-sigma factor RsiW